MYPYDYIDAGCQLCCFTNYSKTVLITDLDTIWKEWGDLDNRFKYYILREKPSNGRSRFCHHRAIIVLRPDTNATLKIDLQINEQQLDGWYISIKRGRWDPGDHEVKISEHTWTPAMVILAIHTFSQNFGSWHLLFNNCWSFTSGLEKFMRHNYNDYSSERPIREKEELQKRIRDFGLNLMMMQPATETRV